MGEEKNCLENIILCTFFCVKLGSQTSWVLVCLDGGLFYP